MPSRPATSIQILRNGRVDSNLELLRIERSQGGKRLDVAEFKVLVPEREQYVADVTAESFSDRGSDDVEVTFVAGGSTKVVHWGRTQIIRPVLNTNNDEVVIVSRVEPFHFGHPTDGIMVYNPRTNGPLFVDRDMIFNPLVDGQVFGNMHSGRFDPRTGARYFLDTESARSNSARRLQRGDAVEWQVADVIYYLMRTLNGPSGPGLIINPTRGQLERIFSDVDKIRNVRVRRNTYLPRALDDILTPLGYQWQLFLDSNFRGIQIQRRGTGGRTVSVRHQRLGERVDTAKTNIKSLGVKFDLSRLANQIRGRGTRSQFEFTFELVRGWPSKQDGLAFDDLRKDSPNFAATPDAYRKWVLNEAGDYIGPDRQLNGIFTAPIRRQLQAIGLVDMFPPRRRRLLPCLTLSPNGTEPIGTVSGVEVEYSNPLFAQPEEPNWLPIGSWGCQLLQQEAGIYFDGQSPPEEIYRQGSQGAVRVTATLEGDQAVTGIARRQSNSPQPDVAEVVLDLTDRFHFRIVTIYSKYVKLVEEGSLNSLQVDDRFALQAFCDRMREAWDTIDTGGPITLEGLDQFGYELGDKVSKIVGREVEFSSITGRARKLPQIAGIRYDVTNQQTTLHLQRVTETRERIT